MDTATDNPPGLGDGDYGEEEELPEAPDGGFGWVVVCAAFTMGLIVDGCLFSFGLMTMEFVEYFDTNKMTIALAGSVMNGIYLTVGPLVTGLCGKYGCRAVAVSGSIVACMGFLASIFSPNVAVLVITYGVVAGIGFGMMHFPSVIMVAFYFTKKRAFATGLAMCGSGIGGFVFAIIIQKLLTVYEWRNAQFIMAGIVLQGCIVGLLLRPVETVSTIAAPSTYLSKDEKLNLHNSLLNYDIKSIYDCEKLHIKSHIDLSQRFLRKDIFYSGSLSSIAKYSTHNINNKSIYSTRSINRPHSVSSHNINNHLRCQSTHNIDYFMSRRESLRTISRSSPQNVGLLVNSTNLSALEKRRLEEKEGIKSSCLSAIFSFVDFSLMRSLALDMYCLSGFLTMLGFLVPFMFLPELALKDGMSRDAATFLLSIIGIANSFGRVVSGWVSDRPWADCLVVNTSALSMGGVALLLIPTFRSQYILLCISAVVFGLSIAVFASLRSIIVVELMGLDKLTNGFGIVAMFQGVSMSLGNPLAGAIYDSTYNYDSLFYFAGCAMILAGLACTPCRRLAIREAQQAEISVS